MVIYLKHPIHGTKVATQEAEALYDESKGWKRYELPVAVIPPVPDFMKAAVVEELKN